MKEVVVKTDGHFSWQKLSTQRVFPLAAEILLLYQKCKGLGTPRLLAGMKAPHLSREDDLAAGREGRLQVRCTEPSFLRPDK